MNLDAAAATHCPYCALQCGMYVGQGEDGRWEVAGRDFPVNKGGLCRKGWTAAELLDSPDRLTAPLIRDRKGGPFREASWDEALDRIAAEIVRLKDKHGPDAIGIFGGGGLTNEKAYLLGKFARVAIGTANIDYNGRFCMASAAAAGLRAFGIDRGLPFPLEDIPHAEVVLLAGGNPAETMPPIMQYFEEQRSRGGRLIVVDPRRTPTAKLATHHLQITPGTDGVLASGLLHIAIQRGTIDRDFIAKRTSGFEAVRRAVASYWPDRVERITGIPARQIEEVAELVGQAASFMVLSGRGPEQQSQGVDNVLSFINLALALGQAGKPFSGYGCMTGQGNGQGGREHGQKADQLPGYRRIDNPAHREAVASVWGIEPDSLPQAGLSAIELLDELGDAGRIKALMVFACNLVISAPDADALMARMRSLDLVVVADIFMSETAALADIVLPVTQWAEEEGTMTNLEGRVIHRRLIKQRPAGTMPDGEILKALADRLGAGHHMPSGPALSAEFRRASAGGVADYAGISLERVDREEGVFWPCPSLEHPGTKRLFLDRFGTEDGRARFHAIRHRASAEVPDEGYPLYLTTGRVLAQYQSGAQTRRVAQLAAAEPEAFVEIHPETAKTLGIADGSAVRLDTRRGHAVMKARFSRDIRLDTMFVPFHWGGAGSANLLTISAIDPISKIPEYKVCAASIQPIAPEALRTGLDDLRVLGVS